jgi:hypothetical protein
MNMFRMPRSCLTDQMAIWGVCLGGIGFLIITGAWNFIPPEIRSLSQRVAWGFGSIFWVSSASLASSLIFTWFQNRRLGSHNGLVRIRFWQGERDQRLQTIKGLPVSDTAKEALTLEAIKQCEKHVQPIEDQLHQRTLELNHASIARRARHKERPIKELVKAILRLFDGLL